MQAPHLPVNNDQLDGARCPVLWGFIGVVRIVFGLFSPTAMTIHPTPKAEIANSAPAGYLLGVAPIQQNGVGAFGPA